MEVENTIHGREGLQLPLRSPDKTREGVSGKGGREERNGANILTDNLGWVLQLVVADMRKCLFAEMYESDWIQIWRVYCRRHFIALSSYKVSINELPDIENSHNF